MLVSRLLLMGGMHALMPHYACAVLGGYLVFFLLVRGWIFYVTRLGFRDPGLEVPDVSGFGGGGGGADMPAFHAGGGHFGGGGASGTFDEPPVFRTLAEAGGRSGGGSGSGGSSWSFDLDLEDGIWIVIALLVLVAVLGGAAIWLVWQAPVILPDAAFEALVAAGLVKAAHVNETRGWMRGVLRSTALPFVLLLATAIFLGWAVHHACPAAIRLADALHHCR